jgi:protocatechuate 3,4-dioxygenase alpha subunit
MPELTPSQTVGPYFAMRLPWPDGPFVVPEGTPGAITIVGRLYDGAGNIIPDGLIETWQAGPDGSIEAPHLDVSVFARGLLDRVVTRMYFPDEPAANAADPVLCSIGAPKRRATLIAVPEPEGQLRFDIFLQGERETVFFDV